MKDPETGGQTPPGHHIELVRRSHHLTQGPVELAINLQGSLVVLGLLQLKCSTLRLGGFNECERSDLVNLGPQLHDCLHPPLDDLGLEGVDLELVRTEIVE